MGGVAEGEKLDRSEGPAQKRSAPRSQLLHLQAGSRPSSLAKLLRARRSHSCGLVGSRSLGGIDLTPFTQGGLDDRSNLVVECADIVGRDDDDVDGDAQTEERLVDLLGQPPAVRHA